MPLKRMMRLVLRGAVGLAIASAQAGAAMPSPSPLDACLAEQALPRVARVIDPTGQVVRGLVVEERGGQPTRLVPLASSEIPLVRVFDRAAAATAERDAREAFAIGSDERESRVCAPVALSQAALDAETQVIVAAGLNFAAHAEEAGGGDVFLFPKPSAPTGPYAGVQPPAGVTLLDYEVELAFVLLEEMDPLDPPDSAALLAQTAFFLSNDVSDRAPIVQQAALRGPGRGFVMGKGQPSFLPAGPWMVRGTELFAALERCGAEGLGLRLWVDAGEGPELRQSASTALMILEPAELIALIGTEIEQSGRRTAMPFPDGGQPRFYPLAIGDAWPHLPAGSVVLTGTPEGVAMSAPSPLGVTLRGMLHLRSPFEQFLAEERARVAAGEGGYLRPGDRVIARIDGLGMQAFGIDAAGTVPVADPCSDARPTSTSPGAGRVVH